MNPELQQLKEKIERRELIQEEREKIDDLVSGLANDLASLRDTIAEELVPCFLELSKAFDDLFAEICKQAKIRYRLAGSPLGQGEEAMWQWFLAKVESARETEQKKEEFAWQKTLIDLAKKAGRRYAFQHTKDGPAIICCQCGSRSFHPEDVRHKYCGNCKEFLEVIP